jgi:hypothetical protein
MPQFLFVTTCNKPRLRDPTKAQDILGRYWFDWDLAVEIEENACDQHRLTIQGEGWPAAWPMPDHCDRDHFQPDIDCDGLSDFERLLEEIAPCLDEPLIVQAIGTVDGRFPLSACEWRVAPGSGTVAKVKFTSSAEVPTLRLFALVAA